MNHRALAYSGVALLGILAFSFTAPMASAASGNGPTATITSVGCGVNGSLFVIYQYSGFPGSVRAVDIAVRNAGEAVIQVKGGTGTVTQAFALPQGATSPFTWGEVSAQLLGTNGRVIPGSTYIWGEPQPISAMC